MQLEFDQFHLSAFQTKHQVPAHYSIEAIHDKLCLFTLRSAARRDDKSRVVEVNSSLITAKRQPLGSELVPVNDVEASVQATRKRIEHRTYQVAIAGSRLSQLGKLLQDLVRQVVRNPKLVPAFLHKPEGTSYKARVAFARFLERTNDETFALNLNRAVPCADRRATVLLPID